MHSNTIDSIIRPNMNADKPTPRRHCLCQLRGNPRQQACTHPSELSSVLILQLLKQLPKSRIRPRPNIRQTRRHINHLQVIHQLLRKHGPARRRKQQLDNRARLLPLNIYQPPQHLLRLPLSRHAGCAKKLAPSRTTNRIVVLSSVSTNLSCASHTLTTLSGSSPSKHTCNSSGETYSWRACKSCSSRLMAISAGLAYGSVGRWMCWP